MGGNQTQIPVIQTGDNQQVQIQQNANKVLRNLQTQVTTLSTFKDQNTIIGEVKLASLTLAQFQAVASKNWILANGQSSVGTAYASFTGNNTVPTVTVAGVNSFIRVN